MFTSTLTEKELDITPPAQEKLYEIMNDGDDIGYHNKAIRIYVYGGGCGGMSYGMTFTELEERTVKDTVRHIVIDDSKEFQVFIDIIALEYLRGAQIDYITNAGQERFVFNNTFLETGGTGGCTGCGGAQ